MVQQSKLAHSAGEQSANLPWCFSSDLARPANLEDLKFQGHTRPAAAWLTKQPVFILHGCHPGLTSSEQNGHGILTSGVLQVGCKSKARLQSL